MSGLWAIIYEQQETTQSRRLL